MKLSSTSIIKVAGLAGLLLILGLSSAMLPLRDWALAFVEAIERLGWIGILAFAGIYVVAVVLLLPAWPLSVSAGLVFGLWGIPLVLASATAGAAAAFFLARRIFRDWVSAWAHRHAYVEALDRAVQIEGWKVVGLLRLSPLFPFTLQNYVFGVSGVSAVEFVVSTFFGIIPGTIMYVYIGTLGQAALAQHPATSGQLILFVVGLFATLIAVVLITRKAKLMLRQIGITPN